MHQRIHWLEHADVALVVADQEHLVDLTTEARGMLRAVGVEAQPGDALPASLATLLAGAAPGRYVSWPDPDAGRSLSLSSYPLTAALRLVVVHGVLPHDASALQQALATRRSHDLRRLFAHLAHDFRNSFAAILYNVQSLTVDGLPNDERDACAQDIAAAANALHRTFSALLDYALPHASAGTATLQSVVESVVDMFSSGPKQRRHSVSVQMTEVAAQTPVPACIVAQVVVALLLNAMEAAPTGSTTTIRGERTIVPPQHPVLTFWVEDRGPGFDAAIRDHVFDAHATTKPNAAGMGLALARSGLRAVGGRIALEDTPVGASVRVDLPLEEGFVIA
jgi:signal transduction histidine kinase